jgi:hypothetical protein
MTYITVCTGYLSTDYTDVRYSETSICRSRIIGFPGSVVQSVWSMSESYLNYGSRIYCFPGSIVSFSEPPAKTMNRGFTVYVYKIKQKYTTLITYSTENPGFIF